MFVVVCEIDTAAINIIVTNNPILDRTEYNQGILKIISNMSKFWCLKEDPTLLREGRRNWLYRKLKKSSHLDSDVYSSICPTGSQPARIYSLPKMHKECGRNLF